LPMLGRSPKMTTILTILTLILSISAGYAVDGTNERVNIGGEVVEYAHIGKHTAKVTGFKSGNKIYGSTKIRSIRIPAHKYIILKTSSLLYR